MKFAALEKLRSIFFVGIFSISGLAITAVQYFRNGSTSEVMDKTLVLASLLVSFLFVVFFLLDIAKTKSYLLLSLTSLIICFYGIYRIESHAKINGVDINKILWFGFGPYVFVLIFVLIPIIFKIFTWDSLSKTIKRIIHVIAAIVGTFAIFALWQGGNSLMEPDSPEYFINELLAIPSGNIPYVDFIPQYGILFTILLSPFSSLLNADSLITLGLYLMSAATVIALTIAVWTVHRALNKKSISLAVLLVIPFTSLAPFPGRESFIGSIYSSPTQIPVRILLGMIIGYLFINYLNDRKSSWQFRIAFILAGLNLWLNTDFGLAIIISLTALFIIEIKILREYLVNSIYFLVGFIIYPVSITLLGKDLNWSYFATFVRNFSAGFGSEPIQTPGPVLVILPLIIALFFASTTPLVLERFKKYTVEPEYRRALLTASFFSCWSLIGFAYYLNRSYASGQMQILFLPLSVASASYFYYLFPKVESIPWGVKDFFKKQNWAKSNLRYQIPNLSLAILMALPIATIVAFPNPQIELKRLTNAPIEYQWPLPKNQDAFTDIENLFPKISSIDEVMYFGSSGNYVSLVNGVKNTTIFNSPFDLFMNAKMVDIQCNYLKKFAPKYLLVNDTGLIVAQAFPNSSLCGLYSVSNEYPSRVLVLNN